MSDYRYCAECETSIDHLGQDAEHCEDCAEELQENDEWKKHN